jgi:hypothetical protein
MTTSKKPPLSVVEPASTDQRPPKPPRKLGEHGGKLWRSVTSEYPVEDIGGIELLAQACAGLDRAESLAACIAEDGEVIYLRGSPKAHPAVKDELACRAFVVRTLQRLGLNVVVEQSRPVGRPAAGVGITWDKLKEKE